MRKIAVIASASGNGKTSVGRELAHRLDVPFVELDALVHGPDWTETPDDELRALVEPIVASEGWSSTAPTKASSATSSCAAQMWSCGSTSRFASGCPDSSGARSGV